MRRYPHDIPENDLEKAHAVLSEACRRHLEAGGNRRDFGTDSFSDQLVVAIAYSLKKDN
jgi:hypothetical protein